MMNNKSKKEIRSLKLEVGKFLFIFFLTSILYLLTSSAYASVSRVEFYRDGTKIGEDSVAPYTFNVDTSGVPNGLHTFSAKAYDAAGNVTTSSMSTVNVSNSVVDPGPWAKGFGGALSDSGTAVAVDASENIFLAGSFSGTSKFGGGELTSAGGKDLVLAKYNSAGIHQWSYRFGGTGDEYVNAIGLDTSGNIYVAGWFTGNGNFGGPTVASKGSYDAFIAKYSPQGQHLWSQYFGSTGTDAFSGLVVDSIGNVIVTGAYQYSVNFGGLTFTTPGHTRIVLAKYSPAGTHLFSTDFVSSNNNWAYGIGIDKNNNVLLTGEFYSRINFGGGDLISASNINTDLFVAKFSTNPNPAIYALGYVWAKRYGGIKTDSGYSIAADGNGDVIVVGFFVAQTDLGGGLITGQAYDHDMFLAKYSGVDGSYLWSKPIIGDYGGWANSVKCDAQNNIVLSGYFYGTFNFGTQTLSSNGLKYDGFAAKYSPGSAGVPGTLVWASSFGGTGWDQSTMLAVDGSNHPVITGTFSGTANFNGTSLLSAGAQDAFLMKMDA